VDSFLAIVWVVGTITGIIFVIRPSTKWAIFSTRKRSLAMLAAVFFLVPVLGAMTSRGARPTSAPSSHTAVSANRTPQAPARDPDTDRAEAINAQFIAGFKSCDQTASAAMSEYKRFESAVSVYEAFQNAKYGCHDSWAKIIAIKIPKFAKRDTRDAYRTAAEECASAVSMKSYAFDKMSKVIDGDLRPSVVSGAKGTLDEANAELSNCAVLLMAASERAGAKLSLDSLKPATK
jgi:hypothetical protein